MIQPGDAIGIMCHNRSNEIEQIIQYLTLDANQEVLLKVIDDKKCACL